ncbi:uncharacterized protein LOC144884870 [Branchiostoma floridae x Branchiostoma japonicum]
MLLSTRSKSLWGAFVIIGIGLGVSLSLFYSNQMVNGVHSTNFMGKQIGATECLRWAMESCGSTDDEALDRFQRERYHLVLNQVNSIKANSIGRARKILLDCGGNIASTVELFLETYPGGHEFLVHSFEMDASLAPYYAPYPDVILHNPVAVSNKDGSKVSYLETTWFPERGLRKKKDWMMGGGTLFAYEDEKNDTVTGGARNLARHIQVKSIDFSSWISKNINKEDYVIFKLDVEGAEYDILQKMVEDGTFQLIDKFYGECHFWHPTGWTASKRQELLKKIKTIGFTQTYWAGEERTYADFDALHPSQVPYDAPGSRGQVLTGCPPSPSGKLSVSIILQVGMNLKSANKLVATLQAHPTKVPMTLFVYGDFAETHPDVVKKWATRFTIGIRENQPYSNGIFEMLNINMTRQSVVSSEMRLNEVGLRVYYYLPVTVQERIKTVAENRNLRIIVPTVTFPPKDQTLTWENYYQHHDVARVPKALRLIDSELKKTGGILCLDSNNPDSVMISVFLLDYLVKKSQYQLTGLENCFSD